MYKNNYKGKFIVFEGLDGSGQSTQVELLNKYLIENGYDVLRTKEPTADSEYGKEIRQVLCKEKQTSPRRLQELFTKDRAWHLRNKIEPALKQDKIVISDRYFFSSFAFGMSDGLTQQEISKLNESFLKPDIIFFLDVAPEISIKRIDERGRDKQLFEKLEKLAKVRKNYKHIFQQKGGFREVINIEEIDGEQRIDEIHQKVLQIIKKIL